MKNRFLRKTITLVLAAILIYSLFIMASAESKIKLTTVYGSSLADVILPDGYTWVDDNPASVSVGDTGNKSFPAKTLDNNGESIYVAVEVTVEPAYISEIYASTDSSFYYTGKPVVPEINAYFNGKKLIENTDYKLVISDNINVGTAKITVEGIGNFKGKTSFYFSIIKKDVEGIILNFTEAELVPGKTVELNAEIITDDATFKGVTWSSSDNRIASVDENGIVTAVNEGVAVITATTNDGGYTAECIVNVVIHDEEIEHEYELLNVSIKYPSTSTISFGDSIILHSNIDRPLPDGAYIEWSESNGNFDMSVSADGLTCKISPKSSGKTVFTATVYDKDGNVLSSDTQEMTAKAGLWQKIVAFFKKIFGLTRTIPEAFKGIF